MISIKSVVLMLVLGVSSVIADDLVLHNETELCEKVIKIGDSEYNASFSVLEKKVQSGTDTCIALDSYMKDIVYRLSSGSEKGCHLLFEINADTNNSTSFTGLTLIKLTAEESSSLLTSSLGICQDIVTELNEGGSTKGTSYGIGDL
jgi:hypothetical protein